jgi:geranylgeranyl pyrophosphate synthase
MFETLLKTYQEKINHGLIYYLPPNDSQVIAAARYSLLAGGKRLRPILFLAYYEAVSGKKPNREVLRAACSLEYAHTASLIHDDLPGIDNDNLRRGRATCHVKFDEATAILAGDFLLIWSLENLTKLKIDAQSKNQLIAVLSTGINQLIRGEMGDILGETNSLTAAELKLVFQQKTSSLFVAVFKMATLLAGDHRPAALRQAQVLGENLGLAFQIQDDVLGVIGETAKLGKTVGLDAQAGKSTWVKTFGLTQAQLDYHHYYHQAQTGLEAKLNDGSSRQFLLELITYLQNREH